MGSPGVRDVGLLDSAATRPRATVFGEDAYPSLVAKAAALTHSIVTQRALVDGDKRLGLIALRLFLQMNGADLRASQDQKFDLIVSIAAGRLRDVDEIAAAIERHL